MEPRPRLLATHIWFDNSRVVCRVFLRASNIGRKRHLSECVDGLNRLSRCACQLDEDFAALPFLQQFCRKAGAEFDAVSRPELSAGSGEGQPTVVCKPLVQRHLYTRLPSQSPQAGWYYPGIVEDQEVSDLNIFGSLAIRRSCSVSGRTEQPGSVARRYRLLGNVFLRAVRNRTCLCASLGPNAMLRTTAA